MEKNSSCQGSPSPRASTNSSSSPEFEFWMVRNPSFPQPQLLSADQLFNNGVLLPLHHLPRSDPDPEPEPPPPSASKRWKDIFKKKSTSPADDPAPHRTTPTASAAPESKKKPAKKGDRKSPSSAAVPSSADLNINIWPFSRSRSAGNGGRTKPPPPSSSRKASSAPCSRSNSRGDSKSRRSPPSPARSGVHLGRSSPVWQIRRPANSGGPHPRCTASATCSGRGGGGVRVLNLNVPLCMGYRHNLSCRCDDNNGDVAGGSTAGGGGGSGSASGGNGNNTLFNLRTLFSKKVY